MPDQPAENPAPVSHKHKNNTNRNLLKTLITIVLGLGGWNLKETHEMAKRVERMDQKLEDGSMERQIQMIWRYAAWIDNELYLIREGRAPATRPTFDLR